MIATLLMRSVENDKIGFCVVCKGANVTVVTVQAIPPQIVEVGQLLKILDQDHVLIHGYGLYNFDTALHYN